MARTSAAARPSKPIFYGPIARAADRMAGTADGRAGHPAVPSDPDAAPHNGGATPYQEVLNRAYLDRAERERLQADIDEAPISEQLEGVRAQIMVADEKVAEICKRLDAFPETPDDTVLNERNVLEQAAGELLVRTRRQREYTAARSRLLADEQQALDKAGRMRIEEGRLAEAIAARERIASARVRRLHEHTRRRCATYLRRLVHKHPDGPAVIPVLELALPSLPAWVQDSTRRAPE
jgi:ABC transport system ATP-binding/permease protein